MMTDTNNAAETIETTKAIALHAALATVDLSNLPTSDLDRAAPTAQQAAAARDLFRALGLKGIAVRSSGMYVRVILPRRNDHQHDDHDVMIQNCPTAVGNTEAYRKVNAILSRVFPGCRDQSEYVSDYFDFVWNVQ